MFQSILIRVVYGFHFIWIYDISTCVPYKMASLISDYIIPCEISKNMYSKAIYYSVVVVVDAPLFGDVNVKN